MVFQDEVAQSSPQTAGLFIFDNERIEVLRGPQNTLYGRNTTGGAVNFISIKPEVGVGTTGRADVTIGSYDQVDVNAAVGSDIGERAAFRLALQSLNNDGYWDNLNIPGDRQGERKQNLARAQLVFEQSENVSWLFNVHGGTSEGGQRPMKSHGLVDPDDPTQDFYGCQDIDIDDFKTSCIQGLTGRGTNSKTDEVYSEIKNDIDDIDALGGFVRLDWQFGDVNFMSLTSYEENQYDHWEENDGLKDLSFILFRQKSDTEQWAQEFRFTSADDQDLRWIAGAYAFQEEVDYQTTVAVFLEIAESGWNFQESEMYSVFGQMEYDLNDKVTLIGGLRYIHEDIEGTANYQFVVTPPGAVDPEQPDQFLFDALTPYRDGTPTLNAPFGDSWNLWGGKLGIEYRSESGNLLYGHITRGEKGGQFTDAPEAVSSGVFFDPVEPEEVLAYEIGYKATWLENTLRTNLALFYNDYTNQQDQVGLPVAETGALSSTLVNVGDSEIYGLELDSNWAPGNGWFVNFALGLLDTEVVKDAVSERTDGASMVEVGRNLKGAPEVTASLDLTKEFNLDNGNLLTFSVNVSYTDERELDLLDTREFRQLNTDPEYTLVNAFAGFTFGRDSQFRLSIWGKNLTDELYFASLQEFEAGNVMGFASNPRTYGATFAVDF
tara:strand:+ start:5459 stop:7444 length:1986 start_codon:yes stop_codon:yes gene_type:complete